MTGQKKKQSLAEAAINAAAGYAVAVMAQVYIFPIFGIHVGIIENLQIGAWFSVVSIARSYILRRIFNRITHKENQC